MLGTELTFLELVLIAVDLLFLGVLVLCCSLAFIYKDDIRAAIHVKRLRKTQDKDRRDIQTTVRKSIYDLKEYQKTCKKTARK